MALNIFHTDRLPTQLPADMVREIERLAGDGFPRSLPEKRL